VVRPHDVRIQLETAKVERKIPKIVQAGEQCRDRVVASRGHVDGRGSNGVSWGNRLISCPGRIKASSLGGRVSDMYATVFI
jgi:hypothetical protein